MIFYILCTFCLRFLRFVYNFLLYTIGHCTWSFINWSIYKLKFSGHTRPCRKPRKSVESLVRWNFRQNASKCRQNFLRSDASHRGKENGGRRPKQTGSGRLQRRVLSKKVKMQHSLTSSIHHPPSSPLTINQKFTKKIYLFFFYCKKNRTKQNRTIKKFSPEIFSLFFGELEAV